MSNLYVRLHSSFWTHQKTLHLRRKLGDAGFWDAEEQPEIIAARAVLKTKEAKP
jgi:hypothetical protein